MTFDQSELFAGFCGAELEVDEFDLGEGIVISKTFAHLMSPLLMAFAPAEPGKPHPAPWRAAEGGFGFDISIQLRIPEDLDTNNWFDRLNTIWWFAALLRFKSAHLLQVPAISNKPFQEAKESETGLRIKPVEVEPRLLRFLDDDSRITANDLEWVCRNWRPGGKLMRRSSSFNLLFQALDQSRFVRNGSLALLLHWSALEPIFSPARYELRFRISANIAAYLEPPGESRLALQKSVAALYDVRSAVAHGSRNVSSEELTETYRLCTRIIEKILETNHTPTHDELRALLFGALPTEPRPNQE